MRRFLDSLWEEGRSPWAVIVAGVPFALLLAGLGLVDSATARLLAVLSTWAIALIVSTYLASQLRGARRLVDERGRVVGELAERLLFAKKQDYVIESWAEDLRTAPGGDVYCESSIIFRAVSEMSFYSIAETKSLDVSSRDHQVLEVTACTFDDAGEDGVEYDVVVLWHGREFRAFVPFHETVHPGGRGRVRIRWRWPGYGRHVLDGAPERYSKEWRRDLQAGVWNLTFERGCGVPLGFAIEPIGPTEMPVQTIHGDGSLSIRATMADVPANARRGFWLSKRSVPRS